MSAYQDLNISVDRHSAGLGSLSFYFRCAVAVHTFCLQFGDDDSWCIV